jgi:hypothetical protein
MTQSWDFSANWRVAHIDYPHAKVPDMADNMHFDISVVSGILRPPPSRPTGILRALYGFLSSAGNSFLVSRQTSSS